MTLPGQRRAALPLLLGATIWSVSPRATPPAGTRPPPQAYFVAPQGVPAADGTQDHPWDLATALQGAAGRIQPGDTVWLRGGRYIGAFESSLTGTLQAPIIVRQYPGERATLDNPQTTPGHSPRFRSTYTGEARPVLRVDGQWTWYWGFEVTNSNPDRRVARANGIFPTKPNNKFINLVVHDNAVGISFSNPSRNSEIYGCIIYDNGYSDIDRTHGHGIYAKNDGRFPKLIRDNVVFNQFRNGIQVYTDAGTGQLKNIVLDGNVWFNNGVLTATNSSAVNILVGGKEIADDITIVNNLTYFSPGLDVRNVRIGYNNTLRNGSVTLRHNYFVGGSQVMLMGSWRHVTAQDNLFAGSGKVIRLQQAPPLAATWDANLYYRDPHAAAWGVGKRDYDLAGFVHATSLGARDQAQPGLPTRTRVFVRPNMYERGRANLIVYNWSREDSVPVDVSSVLQAGQQFEVHNVQDLYGSPLLAGRYPGGALVLPMAGVAPPRPSGGSVNRAPRTGPDFDVFVLTVVPR